MTVRDFEKVISDLMQTIAFKKKKYLFVKQLDENSFGTIGFSIASHQISGNLFVNPVVGVFNKQVEELYSSLTGINTVKLYQPTIFSSIGYLTPLNDYREWEYSHLSNLSAVNHDMLETMKMYGLPFMEKNKNQVELLKCIEERKYILNQGRDYKLPILYYLMGEKQKGLEAIESSIERQNKPVTEGDLPKFKDVKEQINIIGSGYGKVNPEFLRFAEKYRAL